MSNFSQSGGISKDDILEKSRKLKQDEGVESAVNKGSRFGEYTVGIFGALIASFALFYGEFAAAWAALLIVSTYGFGLFLHTYRFTKRKTDLLVTIGSVGSITFFLVLFLATIYGWWIF